ncbi:hypothetical protein Adt_23061 [Abeliophyllum distichum]|uniref:Uncharacterized protein n=1 Tax=Abeliophyllum distichum TaxID=126358 RepID=A0ABD1S9S2_9LAMI
MGMTTSDIYKSLIFNVALLNWTMKSFNSSSFSLVNCIMPMVVFLACLPLVKYAAKLLETSSNVRINFGRKVATQSLASCLSVGRKVLHIIASGMAHNLIKSTKALR